MPQRQQQFQVLNHKMNYENKFYLLFLMILLVDFFFFSIFSIFHFI